MPNAGAPQQLPRRIGANFPSESERALRRRQPKQRERQVAITSLALIKTTFDIKNSDSNYEILRYYCCNFRNLKYSTTTILQVVKSPAEGPRLLATALDTTLYNRLAKIIRAELQRTILTNCIAELNLDLFYLGARAERLAVYFGPPPPRNERSEFVPPKRAKRVC